MRLAGPAPRFSLASAVILVASGAAPLFAQTTGPIPVAVIDARGAFAGLGEDARTARELSVSVDDLPTRALGLAGGVHFYPIRRSTFAIGIGGEVLLARGRADNIDADPATIDLPVERRLQSVSPAISINFGRRDGWSYLTAGMGPMLLETFTGTLPPADTPPRKMTINLGGGARWFTSAHLAFCFDLRFYLTRPENAVGASPGRERKRLMVLSAGISVK